MANTLTAYSPEYWSSRIQLLLSKKLVSREIANFEESKELMRDGVKVHRPTMSDVQVNDYTKGTDVTVQDITAADEFLTVDKTKEATVYIDEVDVAQNKYDVANKYIERITYQLKRDIDGTFLAEVANSSYTLDDSNFGGASGSPTTFNTSTAIKIFATAEAILNQNDVEDTKPRAAVITPLMKASMQQTLIFNGFNKADQALDGSMKGNGFVGEYMNFKVFVSNNVLHTNVFTTTAILVAAETIVLAGVTLTACANGAASGAGGFSISTTEDLCMANVVALINGTGTPGVTTYIELSTANRRKFKNLRLSASYAAHVLTITSSGPITTSKTSTVGVFSTQVASAMFAQYGTIDLVIQRDVQVQKNKEPKKTGYNYLCWDLFGVKTFTEGQQRMVQAKISA